jgi:hypothetical protein
LRIGLVVLCALLAYTVARPQSSEMPLGLFDDQSDVGNVLLPGSAVFNPQSKTYTLSGSGENMWFATDEFHFVWKRVSAQDLTLAANVSILGAEGDGHRKGVLMIRQDLDADSVYVDASRHGDGLTSLQFRARKGGPTGEIESNVSAPASLRLEKRGDRFYLWVGHSHKDLELSGGSARVEMHAPFYIGLGVCAHRKDMIVSAAFTDVELVTAVTRLKAVYSTVETVLLSADARAGFVSLGYLTSPGWGPDGRELTYEIAGRREQTPFIPLKTAAPVGTPVTDTSTSRDIYFASDQSGTQQIWRRSGNDRALEQMTSDEWNNIGPRLSPDGKYVLFLSYPGNLKVIPEKSDIALRVMSLTDKSVKTLAEFVGGAQSIAASPWCPDGRRVAFISYQTFD